MASATKDSRPVALILGLLLTSVAIAVLAAEPLLEIPLRIQRNYNEGWIALFSERAVTGGLLYPPKGAFLIDNYPPLSFYIIGLLGNLTGDDVVAARLLALLGFLVTAGCIWLAARTMTGTWRWAAAAAAIFLLYGVSLFQGYLAMADPQWLAHAVATPALVLLLRRADGKPTAAQISMACVLMLTSGLIKHNLLALPVAVTLWLAWHHRRGLAVWLMASTIGGAVILAGLYGLYGAAVFDGVLGHVRATRFANIRWLWWELRALLPLCVLGALVLLRWNSPRARLVILFAAVAGVWGLFQRLGDGVAYNAQFELVIALCLAIAVGLAEASVRVRWRPATILPAGAAAVVLSLPLIILVMQMLAEAPAKLASLGDRSRQWETLIAVTAERAGPAGCERLAVCYWAGKGFELDFFNYGQRLLTGADTLDRFGALMRARSLKQILVPDSYLDGSGRQVLPPEAVRIMLEYYRPQLTAVEGEMLLLPR